MYIQYIYIGVYIGIYMGKKNVMITVEDFIHEKAKSRGMNVSAICEDALRQRVEAFNKHILPEDCDHQWTWPFSTPGGLVKECKVCGVFKRVEVEGSELIFQDNNLKSEFVENRLKELKK